MYRPEARNRPRSAPDASPLPVEAIEASGRATERCSPPGGVPPRDLGLSGAVRSETAPGRLVGRVVVPLRSTARISLEILNLKSLQPIEIQGETLRNAVLAQALDPLPIGQPVSNPPTRARGRPRHGVPRGVRSLHRINDGLTPFEIEGVAVLKRQTTRLGSPTGPALTGIEGRR